MADDILAEGPLEAGSSLRTPRGAAVAGIIFSVLLITALTLLSLDTAPSDAVIKELEKIEGV